MPMPLARGVAALSLASVLALLPIVPATAAEVKLDAELGQRVLPAKSGGKVYLRLSLKALEAASRERRTPVNVALVLDRSGSMQGPRIAAAKDAAGMAVSRLGSDDIVSLIAYNHNVDVLQPASRLGSHEALKKKIGTLHADGTTALYAGVSEGGRQVKEFLSDKRVNRVILMSDGLANVGPSSPKELADLGRELGSKGITVTTIGLGLQYNEDLMQRLAAASDGNHAFVENAEDLVKFFNSEFGDALSVAAQDIEITIECKIGFKPLRVMGRTADISGNEIRLKLNQLGGAQERYVVVELEAPAGQGAGDANIASVKVEYLDLDKGSRVSADARVRVRFSESKEEADSSLDKKVMSQVTEQIATEISEKAVELRDKGDIAGAKKTLEENATYLGRAKQMFGSGPAPASAASIGVLTDLEKKNREAANNLEGDTWDKTRKSMRYDQHKSKVQQAY